MTGLQLINKVLELDPYDVVKCAMDSFDPYIYIELPEELSQEYKELSEEELDAYSELSDALLNNLRQGNGWAI